MSSILDDNPAVQLLRAVKELQIIGNAFSITGNYNVADSLCELAYIIEDNTKALQKEHMDFLNEKYNDAQKNVGDIMANLINGT